MNKFKATNKREKWLNTHFETKQDIMDSLNLSRPTVDNICVNEDLFFKYIPRISKITGVSIQDIMNQYSRLRDGL
tara:strand:+ start:2458 stop:2682 length:225 start_codon:yes stop_codon:yes gene_type:complete